MVKIIFQKMGDLLQDTIVKMLYLYTLIQFDMVTIKLYVLVLIHF